MCLSSFLFVYKVRKLIFSHFSSAVSLCVFMHDFCAMPCFTELENDLDPCCSPCSFTDFSARYIPLTRVYGPVSIENLNSTGCLFPSISMENDTDRTLQSTVVRCKFGNFVAAAKVRRNLCIYFFLMNLRQVQ